MLAISGEELIARLEDGTLPAESFHHEDHVKVVFHSLRKYPATEVLRRFPEALVRFSTAHGKPGLYHETITWAFVLLIRERMERGANDQTWEEFAETNSDLLNWKDNILRKYYRKETLASELARNVFLLPDKLATPD
jgi:hypothetical protein